MNPWPFIIAAYAIVVLATAGLGLFSLVVMRAAEREAEALKNGSSVEGGPQA